MKNTATLLTAALTLALTAGVATARWADDDPEVVKVEKKDKDEKSDKVVLYILDAKGSG